MTPFWGTILGLVLVGVYLLPGLIAQYRQHTNWVLLYALNVLLGWTGICWVLFMIWAMLGQSKQSAQ